MLLPLLLQAAATTMVPQAIPAPVTPAPATTDNSDNGTEATGDANRMICRSIAQTGSRLGRQRVCQTAGQWQQSRRDTRGAIERAQALRSTNGL